MYTVSEAYKTAVHAATRESKVAITITTANDKTINVTDANLIRETLYIKNQCVNASEFELGAVYAAECGFVFTSEIDRYELFGAKVVVKWSLKTGNNWEEIPLGVFYIAEANRIGTKISIKAYDGMTEFDIKMGDATSGTAYELLTYACTQCGITLGSTETEIEAMPNTDLQLFAFTEQVGTYRDLLAYLSIMLCGFCVIGKDGKLYIRQYKTTVQAELPKTIQRTGTTISDYQTQFCGVVGRFVAEENYYPYEKYLPNVTTGLTLDLGDMPLYRGDGETKYGILENILNVLKDIKYTPSQFEILGNPAIELGDMITIGGYNINTLITSYCWNYRKVETLQSAGSNPRLAGATSGVSKQISQLSSAVANSAVTIAGYTNASQITVTTDNKIILSVDFSAAGGITVLTGVIPYIASKDGHLKIYYYYDDTLLTGGEVTYYTPIGDGVIPIQAHISVTDRNTHTVRVEMCTVEETTEQSKIKARAFHQILDSCDMIITIPSATMKIAILGRAMICQQSQWNGTLTAEEIITTLTTALKPKTFTLTDLVGNDAETVLSRATTENIEAINTKLSAAVNNVTDTIDVTQA